MAHRLSTRGRHAHRINRTHPIRMKSAQGIGQLGAHLRDRIIIALCDEDARKTQRFLLISLLSDDYKTNIVGHISILVCFK